MTKWPADKIERRALEALIPDARNARKHSPAQVAQIAASMREWGWTNPVLIDEDDRIIAGHGRVLAAGRLGFTEVPVMVAEGWTEAQKRAYVIADNQLALAADWDMDLLASEVQGLAEWNFDLSLLGFSDLDELLASGNAGLTDPDDAPETPVEPVSLPGDVWDMGVHRLACGDCTDLVVVRAATGSALPDIAVCDPPYGISVVRGGSIGGAKPFGKVGGGKPHPFAGKKLGRVHGPAKKAIIQPGIYAPIVGDDSTGTAIAAYQMLVELGVPAIVMWGANYYANALPPSRCWLVWDKENTGSFADAELAWTNQNAIVRLLRHQWSGLIKASERGERRVHPTQKPVALAQWTIENIAPTATTVMDPFSGSGATIIAAEMTGRICHAIEIAPAYVDVAVQRWQAFTGKAATLDGDGRTFAEMAAERARIAA